jgi:adenine phosphoribosyltransferase
MKYRMNIAGLDRDLPLCKVSDDLYIGAFVMFGDAEITVACARELLARETLDESDIRQLTQGLVRN